MDHTKTSNHSTSQPMTALDLTSKLLVPLLCITATLSLTLPPVVEALLNLTLEAPR